jgi:5-formyltetrahydrofolate cyclo-ligase
MVVPPNCPTAARSERLSNPPHPRPRPLRQPPPVTNADAKAALRRASRDQRRAFAASLSPAGRDAAERTLAAIVAPALADARRAGHVVASYAATGAEIDPRFIEADLASHAFARVAGGTLTFHLAARRDLVPGYNGIPEPAADAARVVPGVVLVPLLAVAPDGTRLGQGGGFYDRCLAALRARGAVVAIGLAFDIQRATDLPRDPWDERLDYVATPTRLVDCARNR